MKFLLLVLGAVALSAWLGRSAGEADGSEFRELRWSDDVGRTVRIFRSGNKLVGVESGQSPLGCSNSEMPRTFFVKLADGRRLTSPFEIRRPVRATVTESEVQQALLALREPSLGLSWARLRYLPKPGHLEVDWGTRQIDGPVHSLSFAVAMSRLSLSIEARAWEAAATRASDDLTCQLKASRYQGPTPELGWE